MAGEITLTRGEVEECLAVMREAAAWLTQTGRTMWTPDELTRERIANPAEEFLLLRRDGMPAAAGLLSFYDPYFWPDVPPDTSGFLHKLAVRRAFASQGMAEELIRRAAALCRSRGVRQLRLDCDAARPALCALYERAGFRLLERKTVHTRRLGAIAVAMYVLDIE